MSSDISPWMIWSLLGLGLLIAELFTGAFVLLFFGISALVVALLSAVWLRQMPWDSMALEIVLFGILGAGGLLAFRKKLVLGFQSKSEKFQIDQNVSFTLSADVAAHSEGQVQYQGTVWTAVNESDTSLRMGERVRIVKTSGIKLYIQKH